MSDPTHGTEPVPAPSPASESEGQTGTVVGMPETQDLGQTPASGGESGTVEGGFGPLEDPPRLEGVPMIGDPDKAELDGETGGEAVDPGTSVGVSESESPPEIDPALLAIDPDLAARAGAIAEETVRIGQQVSAFEQSQAFGEADQLKPVEEEST